MQSLGSYDDLPQSSSANTFAERRFWGVDKRIRDNLAYHFAFRLIDKRAVGARDNKIDFGLTEIAQDSI